MVDMASNQALPGGILLEFAHIAREYFWKAQESKASVPPPNPFADEQVTMTDDGPSSLVAGQHMEAPEPFISQHPNHRPVREKTQLFFPIYMLCSG